MWNLTEIKRKSGEMNVPLSVGYGKKFAHGTTTLGASLAITTGLTTVDAFFAAVEDGDAADVNKVVKISWTASAGVVTAKGWKHTGASTPTLVAASASATVSWMAFGDK
jgi:hypothetical protein